MEAVATRPETTMETDRQILDFDRDVANFGPDINKNQFRALQLLDSGLIKFLLFGGALGGGKSRFLRWYLVRRLLKLFEKYRIRDIPVMLACEDYPALKDRQLVKLFKEFPKWLGQHTANHKIYGNCFLLEPEYGSGALCFRNLDDPSKYMSSEWAAIGVDELTKNKYGTFTDLRMRLRYPGIPDIECQFVGGTNPGGIGHGWVKQLWMTKQFPPEWYDGPIDYRKQFAYVPSLADDNPYLDPGYWQMLNTLSAPLRKAFRYGDWSTFIGQAFPEITKVAHEYKPTPDNLFPQGAWIGMTFDWGFGKPFSLGWWHTDADGRLYRAAEWYGWSGTADEGLRMPDSLIAEGIKKREEKWGISNLVTMRKAGPDCFQKKPNYKGGGQGKSTAEIFRDAGIVLTPGDPSRELKIRQFRERLRIQDDGLPMMLINADCENFWRTVPDLIVDENNIEDVDTKGEDHPYDEACHVCMARPLLSVKPVIVIRRPPKDASEVADLERQRIWEEINQANEQNLEPY